MLVNFKVDNYRSFKNEQEFSMETGKRLSKFKDTNTISFKNNNLLKSSLVFGANANGKTNMLKALIMLKNLVIRPTSDELEKLETDTFAKNNNNTSFEIEFIKNQHKYEYIIEYNKNEIVVEKLNVDNIVVFERLKQTFSELPEQLKPIVQNVRKNQNLLNFAQQNNETRSKEAYQWFAEDIVPVDMENIPNIAFKDLENEQLKNKFLNFLRAADFNIIDLEVRTRTETVPNPEFLMRMLNSTDVDGINQSIQSTFYDVYSEHQSETGTFKLHFNNESSGTKVFMFLALYILNAKNKVLLIDEFDRSYHLELAQALISLINSEKQTNQFILTTHELSLMDCKLRQDQIWFAEKNQFGESELFSLFDFDDPALKRSDFNYKKRYLEGRYGATQIINKNLLLEALDG